MLGAEGVVLGTRLVATDECNVHQRTKQALVEAGSQVRLRPCHHDSAPACTCRPPGAAHGCSQLQPTGGKAPAAVAVHAAMLHAGKCAGMPWIHTQHAEVSLLVASTWPDISGRCVRIRGVLLQARDRPATIATGLFDDLDAPANIKQLGATWPYKCIARALQTPFTDQWGRVRPLKASLCSSLLSCRFAAWPALQNAR